MSFKKDNSKTTSNATETTHSTSTPQILPSLQYPLDQMGRSIGGILDWESRPDGGRWGADFIAPASQLQTQGFGRAGQLGGWREPLGQAQALARQAAGAGPITASATYAEAPEMRAMQGYTAARGVAPQADVSLADGAQIDRGSVRDLRAGSLRGADLGGYMNPYEGAVVEAAMGDLSRARRVALADVGGGANDAGAWGGSRHGVAEGEAARAYAETEGRTAADLRYRGYNAAMGFAGADLDRDFAAQQANQGADLSVAGQNAGFRQQTHLRNADALTQGSQYNTGLRQQAMLDYLGRQDTASQFGAAADNTARLQEWQGLTGLSQFNAGQANTVGLANQSAALQQRGQGLQAAGLLGDLSQAYGQMDLADLSGLLGAGGEQRAIDQQQRQSYLTLLQQLGGLLNAAPFGATTGQVTNATGTKASTGKSSGTSFGMSGDDAAKWGEAAMAAKALGMFSDDRLKVGVETAGYDAAGRRWVDYEYVWEPGVRRRGVIAQEVRETDPDAVHEHESGFLMVDYAKLGAR